MIDASNSIKWKLLLKILPFAILFGCAKVGMHRLGWEPWEFDSLTGALFGATTFVIAFVLSGTLRDYNASEDIPIQLANSVDTIHDINQLVAIAHADYDAQPLSTALIQVLQATEAWLMAGKPQSMVETTLDLLNIRFANLQAFANPQMVGRAQAELAKIRILITRMQMNRDTDFLKPAYALLEIFLAGVVVALLLIGADRFSENLVVSCFLFISFSYLLMLIRDLDDPFQYDGRSSIDVDLSLFAITRDRLQAKLPPQPPSIVKGVGGT